MKTEIASIKNPWKRKTLTVVAALALFLLVLIFSMVDHGIDHLKEFIDDMDEDLSRFFSNVGVAWKGQNDR